MLPGSRVLPSTPRLTQHWLAGAAPAQLPEIRIPCAGDLIGVHTAGMLSRAMEAAAPGAPLTALRAAAGDLANRPLRDRGDLLRDALLADLLGEYTDLAGAVRWAAGRTSPLCSWLVWPVTCAIATGAVAAGEVDRSTKALLAESTGRPHLRVRAPHAARPRLRPRPGHHPILDRLTGRGRTPPGFGRHAAVAVRGETGPASWPTGRPCRPLLPLPGRQHTYAGRSRTVSTILGHRDAFGLRGLLRHCAGRGGRPHPVCRTDPVLA